MAAPVLLIQIQNETSAPNVLVAFFLQNRRPGSSESEGGCHCWVKPAPDDGDRFWSNPAVWVCSLNVQRHVFVVCPLISGRMSLKTRVIFFIISEAMVDCLPLSSSLLVQSASSQSLGLILELCSRTK